MARKKAYQKKCACGKMGCKCGAKKPMTPGKAKAKMAKRGRKGY